MRQQFVDQEPRVGVAEAVVFIAAIEPVERLARGRFDASACMMKRPIVTGISLAGDQAAQEDLGRMVLDVPSWLPTHTHAGLDASYCAGTYTQ